MYYGGSTYGRKHKFFFLGLDTFGHNIIVSIYTQSPANNVTFFTFLAENSSHVVDTTYFSSPLSCWTSTSSFNTDIADNTTVYTDVQITNSYN